MDEASNAFSIPWWIWLAGGVVVIGGIIVFALKYQKLDDQQYRPYRDSHSSGRRSRRRSGRSRHRE